MHYIYFRETDIFLELNSHVSLVKETMSLNFHFPRVNENNRITTKEKRTHQRCNKKLCCYEVYTAEN